MALHSGEPKRQLPAEAPVVWDPNRRDLKENEDWYRDLVEHSQDLLCVHDLEGRFLSVNPVPARLLGYSVEEMLKKPMRDFIDPQFRSEFDAYLLEIKETGESHGLLKVITRSGEHRVWEYHNTLRTEGLVSPIVRGIAHDVTERVRAEKALRKTNERLMKTAQERERVEERLREFERVVENLEEMIVVVNREYRFVLANRLFLNYREMRKEDVVGHLVVELVNPDVYETLIKKKLDECFQGKVVNYELKQVYPRVGEREISITYLPVEGSAGIDRVACVVRDVTERRRAEEALRESEARERARVKELETVLEAVPIAVCIAHDVECHWMSGNRAAYQEMGVPPGQNISKSVPPERQPRFRLMRDGKDVPADLLPMQQAVATGTPTFGFPLTIEREDGTVRETLVNAVPLLDDDGKVRGAVGASIDLTELKLAEKALRDSELRFRTVYERSPVGIALVDSRTGRFLQVNPKFCEIVGRSDKELALIDLAAITHPDDVARGNEYVRQLAEEQLTSYEIDKRYVRPDGSVRWVRVLVVPMWGKGDTFRWQMGLVEDITERKRAEEALRESEERFRVALKNSPIAVFNQDRDLRYTWVYNPQIPPMTASEKLHGTVADILDHNEALRVTQLRQKVLETGVGVRHEMHVEFGGRKHYFDATIEPVVDAAGTVIGLTGASTDVTELREATEALRQAKRKLTEEKLYLEQEIDTELGFGNIIGQSKTLQTVMENVGKVAASDATVLLLGETGTGKELVARAIHRLSQRANSSFIKLNCAAIPSGLLESELFGNEKGAFTGAVSRKIGRLELADKGTLFLDEIGEISLALQPKLLRVLQDQEFERLGGTQTLKVDFRLIAATNRDLASSVQENEFRSDLYYRLNVFPIRVPPLRERRDDIPVLVEHFVQKFTLRMNKSITSIPKKTMDALMQWEWPGNVRELENFIERSVILTQGSVLVAPLSEMESIPVQEKISDETLETTEREHIIHALRESHGQIGGLRGAAMRLGLKRTTLQSKLKHLGIDPRSGRSIH
jgi:formate hydrogenlyase transcriptional activator